MKAFKTIFGFFLLYSAGDEYVNASRQLGSFLKIGIIIPIVLFLILSTWLIGSGLSVKKFKFKSFEFVKFLILSLVTFAIFTIFNLNTKIGPTNFVEINGITIPLGKCISGNKRIIPDENERKEYCKCFAEKIINVPELKEKYQSDFENDNINDIIKEIQTNEMFLELGIENCFSSIEIKWTKSIVKSMTKNWKKELKGTEFELTNNIDKYCDCLISEYKKQPLSKIMEDNFIESTEALEIDEKCSLLTKK